MGSCVPNDDPSPLDPGGLPFHRDVWWAHRRPLRPPVQELARERVEAGHRVPRHPAGREGSLRSLPDRDRASGSGPRGSRTASSAPSLPAARRRTERRASLRTRGVICRSPSSASSSSSRRWPDVGERDRVHGGHRRAHLYLDCRGQGSPTVILEGGLTSDTSAWDDVIDPSLASPVCARTTARTTAGATTSASTRRSERLGPRGAAGREEDRPVVRVGRLLLRRPISRLFAARHPDDLPRGSSSSTPVLADYRSEGSPFVPDDVRDRSYWASENDEKLDLDATLDLVRGGEHAGFNSAPIPSW